jgi:hypothetical protein
VNLDDLVRDALDDMAHDVAGPNEADLMRRFAHKDRVARVRRATVAASGLALALAVALFIGGSAHGASTPQRVHVEHHGGQGGSASTKTLPRNAHSRENSATGAHQAGANVASPTRLSPTHGGGQTPSGPTLTSPAVPGGLPSVTVPVTAPSSHGGSGPTIETTTTTTVPPAFTITNESSQGAKLTLLGQGQPGDTIRVLSPYLGSQTNSVFHVTATGGWGGSVVFKINVGQTITVTLKCSCGESQTLQFTRTS